MKANGWKSMSLGDIALMSQYGLSCPASADGDVPMLRMNNLTTDGKLDTSDLVYVRLSNDEFEKYRLQKGDLLFNRTNSYELVGKTTLFELDEDYVFASYLIRFKLNPNLVDPRFVSYFFNTDESKDHLRKLASKGVSQSNINPTILKERFFVPVPPLQAQREIAETLRCWDHTIEHTEKLVTAKTRIKRGLTQQLLTGKKRFPQSRSSAWKEVRLGDVSSESKLRNDGSLTSESLMAVTKLEGMIPMRERVRGESVERCKVVRKDWFAYNPMRLNIGSIARWRGDEDVLVSPDYVVFKCDESKLDPSILDHLRRTHQWTEFVESSGDGSVRVRIWYSHLVRILMIVNTDSDQA
jgi:type I restriction enzyme S subunit